MDDFSRQQGEQRVLIESREEDLVVLMQKYGGHFASNLATAWLYADVENRAKLRVAFGALLCSYAKFLE